MLVPDPLCLEALLVMLVVDGLEDIFEAAVVRLEDRVLRAHEHRQALEKRHLERRVREAADRLVRVVLQLRNTGARKVIRLDLLGRFAIRGRVDELQRAGARDNTVFGTVLVAEGVSADDYGLLPAWDEARNSWDDNGFTENGAATERGWAFVSGPVAWVKPCSERRGGDSNLQDVANGAIRR